VVWGTLSGLPASLMVGSGHERALAPPFVLLLVGTVGGAFASVLVPLCLALEDASAKGLRSRQAGARASVLAAVVASIAMRMIAVVGSFSWVAVGASVGVESDACVVVTAETLMYQDRSAPPATLWCLVD